MDDFKIIFYIAIGIAWVIYKNFQKVQQNRPKTVTPQDVKTRTTDIENSHETITLQKIKQKKQEIYQKEIQSKKDIGSLTKIKEAKPAIKNEIKKKKVATQIGRAS